MYAGVTQDTAYAWHANGIHTYCEPLRVQRIGTASGVVRRKPSPSEQDHTNCEFAGKIARYHSHDFDGPLPCDCEDF